MARRSDPLDKSSMVASFAVHGGIVLVLWLSGLVRPEPIDFISYEITLVSPPPAVQAEVAQPATEQLVVERPEPTPPAPEPEPEEEVVPIVQEDDPPPQPPEPESTPVEELAEEETTAASTEDPPEDAAESGEDLNVRMEGLRRDYPAYYNGIIRQIDNCFRPPRDGGDWATTVFFNIERDGSVAGVEFVSRSGSFDFDFSAMGAIECAGNGRFGPLPEDYQWDRLPVQFDFKPRGELLGIFPTAGRPSEVTSL